VIIAIGSDHRGQHLKQYLIAELQARGHQLQDCGCPAAASSDYPEAAFAVGELVTNGRAQRGILVCGSGIGMAIAANKVVGVRAAPCGDVQTARQTRRHNDSNVLCLGGDHTPLETAVAIAESFLATDFEGGRHMRRVEMIKAYEARSKN
jgi:ribose 5-phosphate isomerase B